MEFKDLFEFFAAFGAVGSAALSYQAVKEMKRQREANFKPELILGKSDPIFIYGAVNSQINIPFIISQNEDQRNNFGYDDDIYISLYNIGAAPAKNVRINWNCNYARL
ncbi:MAG: hypothetical protein IPL22_20580 [Bacteroidetes bacterium]|nr:hypothetical protein [Bacteroidota bacterium]